MRLAPSRTFPTRDLIAVFDAVFGTALGTGHPQNILAIGQRRWANFLLFAFWAHDANGIVARNTKLMLRAKVVEFPKMNTGHGAILFHCTGKLINPPWLLSSELARCESSDPFLAGAAFLKSLLKNPWEINGHPTIESRVARARMIR
jgi:hypothetical protein